MPDIEHLYFHFIDGSKIYVGRNYATQFPEGGSFMTKVPMFIKMASNNAEPKTYLGSKPFRKVDLDGNTWVFDGSVLTINNTSVMLGGYSNFNLFLDDNNVLKYYISTNTSGDSAYPPAIQPYYSPGPDMRTSQACFLDSYNEYATIEEFLTVSQPMNYVRFTNVHSQLDNSRLFVMATVYVFATDLWVGNGGAMVPRGVWSTGSTLGSNFPGTFTNSLYADGADPVKPYLPGDDDPEGQGGSGPEDFEDIPVPRSGLPTISAAATGFTRLYNPSLAQLKSLAQYMWTDTTFWDTLKNHFMQILDDPMKYMIALNLVPCAVPNGANEEFKLLFIGTGVSMPPVTNQFVDVDCGTVTVPKQFNSAMDYAPYTKVSCFLPYIGTVQLDTDEVMGKDLHLWYRIDVFTGGCVADIVFDGGVRYEFTGQCAINIPFSSADFTGYISAMLQAAKAIASIGAAAAGSGALASELAGLPEPKTSQSTGTITTTNYDKDYNFKGSSVKEYDLEKSGSQASFGGLVMRNIANTVGAVMCSKPNIQRSGGFSGNTGYLGVRRPYLTLESPRLVNPSQYGSFNGYPCMKYLSFAEIKGFTQVQQIQLSGFGATNPEIDEIQSLLKSGVIF